MSNWNRIRIAGAVMFVLALLSTQYGVAQPAGFARGDHVRERIETKPSEPKQVGMVVTVVAVPGDRIRIAGSVVYVNNEPVRGFSQELLARVARSNRVPQIMAKDEYLVTGEQNTIDDVIQKWATYSVKELEPAPSEGVRP